MHFKWHLLHWPISHVLAATTEGFATRGQGKAATARNDGALVIEVVRSIGVNLFERDTI